MYMESWGVFFVGVLVSAIYIKGKMDGFKHGLSESVGAIKQAVEDADKEIKLINDAWREAHRVAYEKSRKEVYGEEGADAS